MKGYVVGYLEEWAFQRAPVIIGYYTGWKKAVEQAQLLETENINNRNGLLIVYIVVIPVNKTIKPCKPNDNWFINYPYYILRTENSNTIAESNTGHVIDLGSMEKEQEWISVESGRRSRQKRSFTLN